MAQRACAEHYPPVLHQATLLSEIADVTLLDELAPKDDPRTQTNGSVSRLRVERKTRVSSPAGSANVLLRMKWLRDYRKAFRRQAKAGVDFVVAYDPDAINLMLTTNYGSKPVRRVAHLHEITRDDPHAPLATRLRLKLMLTRLARADLVVVPDRHRAELLQSMARLKREPIVVMNCPRHLPELPDSLLLPMLKERGITTDKIVHYQGSVGPDHSIETVIKSMSLWPPDAVLVIVGGGREDYLAGLTELTKREGVEQRVVFTGRIPYDQLFRYAVGASVGVTLLDPSIPNWRFSAGASNKRFEYSALGIPQVTNDGPGIRELFVDTGMAMIADQTNAEDVGRKIAQYLVDDSSRKNAGAKARAIHLDVYNYEHQFQRVLDLLGGQAR